LTVGVDCATKELAVRPDGHMDAYVRAHVFLHNDYEGIGGEAHNCGTSDDFTCEVSATGGKDFYPIQFFDTDYENYDIFYACWDIADNTMHQEVFTVYTREDVPFSDLPKKV
jgi:hypothetical protein